MDRIKLFKYPGDNSSEVMMLCIGEDENYWELPGGMDLKNPGKFVTFQLEPETISAESKLELYEEGKLRVDYCKKKKIKFSPEGIKNLSGDYIFYIPSWGFHTERKIWVLISPVKK